MNGLPVLYYLPCLWVEWIENGTSFCACNNGFANSVDNSCELSLKFEKLGICAFHESSVRGIFRICLLLSLLTTLMMLASWTS